MPTRLSDGRVSAITYVADLEHPQYAGRLEVSDAMRIVRTAHGIAGRNVDYVWNTQAHLLEVGVHDQALAELCAALGREEEPGRKLGS